MKSSKEFFLRKGDINPVLHTAIFEIWPSISAFHRQSGLDKFRTSELLRLKLPPLKANGKYRSICFKLSEYLGISITELFPLDLYGIELEFKQVSLESLSEEELNLLEDKSLLGSPLDAVSKKIMNDQISKIVDNIITPKQEALLCKRFNICKPDQIRQEAEKRGMSEEKFSKLRHKTLLKLKRITFFGLTTKPGN